MTPRALGGMKRFATADLHRVAGDGSSQPLTEVLLLQRSRSSTGNRARAEEERQHVIVLYEWKGATASVARARRHAAIRKRSPPETLNQDSVQ